MRKHCMLSLSIPRSFAVPAVLVLLLSSKPCNPPPAIKPPPDLDAESNQALQMVIRQSEETHDFVARFKGKFPAPIPLARNKYDATLSEVNSVVDELKKAVAGSSTLTEDEFKTKAKSAVDANVEFNTLMERAVDDAIDFHNFVLHNANTLPDSWTTLRRKASSLSEPQKQQFASYLESNIRYKPWDVIKKK